MIISIKVVQLRVEEKWHVREGFLTKTDCYWKGQSLHTTFIKFKILASIEKRHFRRLKHNSIFDFCLV